MDQQLVHKYLEELSKAEYPVAELVTKGCSVEEIADKLCVSPHTVRNHKVRICKKWGARNSVDIARKFILSLDNPKHFFAWLIFLGIQINILFPNPDIDWRTPQRPLKTASRTVRTSRKYDA